MKRTPQLLDAVAVLVDCPELGLVQGQVGMIVETLADGFFEVEFTDDEGVAYASAALPTNQIMPLRYRPQQVAG